MTPSQKWKSNNREKLAAHWLVKSAIEQGKLQREPCSVCRSTTRIHAHHEDYTRPLDVIWLCGSCHNVLHARTRGQSIHYPGPRRGPRKEPTGGRKKVQPSPKRDLLEGAAIQLRITGMSYENIAKELGISQGTVYRWVNDKFYPRKNKE